jgi:starch phosphorylase
MAALEMLRQGWSREELSSRSLFTTHTPVAAGHDRFEWNLVESVVGDLAGPNEKEVANDGDQCSMSHLGIGLAGNVNAVSVLNAEVASKMFPEAKISPITNGVHHPTWISPTMARLYDEELRGWRSDGSVLVEAGTLSETGLERARSESRAVLRELVKSMTGVNLDGNRLTIGFARRFATYKRASLVFRDIPRLNMIGSGNVQFVFSGKAHPRDEGGKALIREIFDASGKLDDIPVAFLEDYSMATGLAMTSGVDIWLNTPVRPMEASGTSGMKAVMNGVPNLSILDGWWPEACRHGINGWGIGDKEDSRDDDRDANALYDLLEDEVLPAWKSSRERWLSIMRSAIIAGSGFTGQRMIREYENIYETFGI